ncbi:palmitoyltransferase [Plakobranchus ocellatus]|uniref:Palmitoyltransferase n=1 Tax=Plakobranchus ocellatus TaxID=259542 RepID=A0AAV4E219_9GAST|nr:palmitoyltransferase [Plakobranchus ocellatus]
MPAEKRRSKTSWQNLTLQEKFQQHWETRKFEPSDLTITRFGVSFVWINTICLVVEGFAILLPHFFKDEINSDTQITGLFLSKVATVYLFVGTVFQWWYLRDGSADKVSTSATDGLSKSIVSSEGWKFCTTCKLHCPPRSHHCSLCNACILKRDHHCFFSGSCVGYHNQRHFIIFLVYACIASIYGVFMQGAYLKSEEGYSYFFPLLAVWRTVTRQSYLIHLILLLHLCLSITLAVASASFASWQVRIILKGQTSYEAMKGSIKYSKFKGDGSSEKNNKKAKKCSFYKNFESACGTPLAFSLCLLVPVVKTKLPGDGIKWDP